MKEELVFLQNNNQFRKLLFPVACKKKRFQVLFYQTKILKYNNRKKYLKTLDIITNRIKIMRYTKYKKGFFISERRLLKIY